MIAQPLSQGNNAIKIHDRNFDQAKAYQIKLTDIVFCTALTVVDVDGFSFCGEYAKLFFELPCMEIGQYKLEIIDKDTLEVIYTLNSKFTESNSFSAFSSGDTISNYESGKTGESITSNKVIPLFSNLIPSLVSDSLLEISSLDFSSVDSELHEYKPIRAIELRIKNILFICFEF